MIERATIVVLCAGIMLNGFLGGDVRDVHWWVRFAVLQFALWDYGNLMRIRRSIALSNFYDSLIERRKLVRKLYDRDAE
jgi:hypothetical protein